MSVFESAINRLGGSDGAARSEEERVRRLEEEFSRRKENGGFLESAKEILHSWVKEGFVLEHLGFPGMVEALRATACEVGGTFSFGCGICSPGTSPCLRRNSAQTLSCVCTPATPHSGGTPKGGRWGRGLGGRVLTRLERGARLEMAFERMPRDAHACGVHLLCVGVRIPLHARAAGRCQLEERSEMNTTRIEVEYGDRLHEVCDVLGPCVAYYPNEV